jgi:hypothetical protein
VSFFFIIRIFFKYSTNNGLGPIKLILFFKILKSCGSSSKPVFLKKFPNLFCLFFQIFFLKSYKVLNLYNVKILLFKPGLFV